MGKRFVIAALEQKYGNLNNTIPPLVNAHGQAETGRLLGTTQATISNWLKDNGYSARIIYERPQQESTSA